MKNLLNQPAYISRCNLVKQFFAPREGDYEIEQNANGEEYRLSQGSQPSSTDSPAGASRQSSRNNLNGNGYSGLSAMPRQMSNGYQGMISSSNVMRHLSQFCQVYRSSSNSPRRPSRSRYDTRRKRWSSRYPATLDISHSSTRFKTAPIVSTWRTASAMATANCSSTKVTLRGVATVVSRTISTSPRPSKATRNNRAHQSLSSGPDTRSPTELQHFCHLGIVSPAVSKFSLFASISSVHCISGVPKAPRLSAFDTYHPDDGNWSFDASSQRSSLTLHTFITSPTDISFSVAHIKIRRSGSLTWFLCFLGTFLVAGRHMKALSGPAALSTSLAPLRSFAPFSAALRAMHASLAISGNYRQWWMGPGALFHFRSLFSCGMDWTRGGRSGRGIDGR